MQSMVEIEIAYEGTLRCSAMHKPSKRKILTDAPVDNHGKGESFSPTDLVATALGTCVITIMGIHAGKHGISLDGASVVVQKQMSTDMPRRIIRMPVSVEIPVALDETTKAALETAARNCPVHHSLHPDIDAPIEFKYSK